MNDQRPCLRKKKKTVPLTYACSKKKCKNPSTKPKVSYFFFTRKRSLVIHSFKSKNRVFFFPKSRKLLGKKKHMCFFFLPRKSSLSIHSRSGEGLDSQNFKNSRYNYEIKINSNENSHQQMFKPFSL